MRAVEATAPCRVDLGGEGLDSQAGDETGAGTFAVGVAVDRRAWARAERVGDGFAVESKDTLRRAEASILGELVEGEPRSLVFRVLEALAPEPGLRVVMQSRVPAGAGLGERAALGVAVAAAVSRVSGRPLDADGLWSLVRDAASRAGDGSVGLLDSRCALDGGAIALRLECEPVAVERLEVDPGRVEECLLLVDASASSPSSAPEHELRLPPGDAARESVRRVAAASRGVREALLGGRFSDLVGLLDEEWEARRALGQGAVSPEAAGIVEIARGAGAAARPCGGKGGVVAIWAPPGPRGPGPREAVERALGGAGRRFFPARLDLRGLEVD